MNANDESLNMDDDRTENKVDPCSDPFAPQRGHSFSWTGVEMTVRDKKRGDLQILKGLDGVIKPKELCAIIGCSGAGKTSLLNVLSGKVKNKGNIKVNGVIKIDGIEINPASIEVKRKIAFVAQRDTLLAWQTARESIGFAARLRLPKETTDDAVEALTNKILKELGLAKVADSLIGGDHFRGVSGGEMRRISLGVELVVRPSIVFLDEVTSGLDSHSASTVMSVCKSFAESGAAVVMVIHQPDSKSFSILDHLILVNDGQFMYSGSAGMVPEFFAEHGYKIPEYCNPAQWIVEVAATEDQGILKEKGFYAESSAKAPTTDRSERFSGYNRNSIFQDVAINDRISLWKEFRVIFARDCLVYYRSNKLNPLRLGMTLVAAGLYSIFFVGVGRDSLDDENSFLSHVGTMFVLVYSAGQALPLGLLDAVDQAPVFIREFRTDHYSVFSYCLSKFVIDLMDGCLMTVALIVIPFYAIGMRGSLGLWLAVIYLTFQVSVALGHCLVAIFQSSRVRETAALVLLPQMLLTGFIVSPNSFPSWIRWILWIMPFTSSFRLLLNDEFSDCLELTPQEMHNVNCVDSLRGPLGSSGLGTTLLSPVYNEETNLVFAQAGMYHGKSAIIEYNSFASTEQDPISLVWNNCNLANTRFIALNKASDSICDITLADVAQLEYNPMRVREEEMAAPFVKYVFGQRLVWTYDEALVPTITDHNYYYSPRFLERIFLEVSDNTKLADFICETMAELCPETFKFNNFTSRQECANLMETLPLATTNVNGLATIDGNSTGCRNLHATLASTNVDHCPHISYHPQEDKKGQIKCSSEYQNNFSLNDFWDDGDFALFEHTASVFGLDPELQVQFSLTEDDLEQCATNHFDQDSVIGSHILPDQYVCYQYLQEQEATGSRNLQYWMVLLAYIILLRGLSVIFLPLKA